MQIYNEQDLCILSVLSMDDDYAISLCVCSYTVVCKNIFYCETLLEYILYCN